MSTTLLLFLCLIGHMFAKEEPPDVDCIIIHLKSVRCSWNKTGTPAVNYTIFGRFHFDKAFSECTSYLSENGINTGCDQLDIDGSKRFNAYHTELVHGNKSFPKQHALKARVKLNPPTNLTVQNGSDSNLWFYWNQTIQNCVESEVRVRINYKKWKTSHVSIGKHSYCINLPSQSSRYELQVRSKIGDPCGGSIFWSDWSEPVVWGSNNSTDTNSISSVSVWTLVLFVLSPLTLIVLVITLLHCERLRIIFIPVVPKLLIPPDIEGWLQISKGLKEGFEASYNERACPVSEYGHISESDSESSDSSTFSLSTDQTDCSANIPA